MTPQTSELVQLDLDSVRRSVTGRRDRARRRRLRRRPDGHARRRRRPARGDRPGRRRRRRARRSIRLARETGLELAVRCGGHSGAGHGTAEGGIVLDVRDLDGLEIDVTARTAWAGSGLTAGEYTIAAAEHGLATGFGDTGSVGLGGITLGGGIGYLVRKHGLTIDNLLAAEIVTADGEVRDGRRRPRPGPVLGDPRRRRQLRRRDAVPVPAAPGARGRRRHADPARDGGHDRGLRRGRRGGARGAVDDRQRHALPADAVRAGGAARQARDLRPAVLGRAGRRGPGRDRAVPRARRRPSPTCSGRCRTPRCTRRRIPTTTRSRSHGRCSSTGSTARSPRPILERLEASDAAMRVAQLRVLGGAMARVARPPRRSPIATARSWSTSRRSTRATTTRPRREAWVTDLAAALHQRDGAYVNFLADEGEAASAPPIPAGPGTGSRRSSGGTTRTTCSTATRTSRPAPEPR